MLTLARFGAGISLRWTSSSEDQTRLTARVAPSVASPPSVRSDVSVAAGRAGRRVGLMTVASRIARTHGARAREPDL